MCGYGAAREDGLRETRATAVRAIAVVVSSWHSAQGATIRRPSEYLSRRVFAWFGTGNIV